MVNTVVLPGGDAAVLRIGDTGRGEMTERGIAVSSDCNGRYCYLDPYVGAQIALAEAARNVACVGGEPAAITDCLNFGSPEKPEVFWTFHEADPRHVRCVQGVGHPRHQRQRLASTTSPSASRSIRRPRSGSSVSLDDVNDHATVAFKLEGDVVDPRGRDAR